MTMSTMMIERPAYQRDIVFCGRFTEHDFARLNLDSFDRALLDDVGKPGASPADWLLGLEMLFRRAREQGLL